MTVFKRLIENILGYHFINKKQLGLAPFSDLATLLKGKEVKTIIDIGANEGQTTEKLLKLFPNSIIYCFEPGNEAFSKLKSKFDAKKVASLNFALGDKEETCELIKHESSVTDSFLIDDFSTELNLNKSRKILGKERVKISTLDIFCAENNISSIDFIKIDTQGYELKVINGAKKLFENNKIKFILIEVCFVSIYKKQPGLSEIHKRLDDYGFKIIDFYNKARGEDNTLMWCDILYQNFNY